MVSGDHMEFVDQVIGPHRLRAVSAVGETFPLLIGKDGGWNDNAFMTKTSLILNPPPPREPKVRSTPAADKAPAGKASPQQDPDK